MRPWVLAAVCFVSSAHAAPDDGHGPWEEATRMRSIGEYVRAAELFERFAHDAPTDARAPQALSDATLIRLVVGDEAHADVDAEAYFRAFANKTDDAARLASVMIVDAADQELWADVERRASREMVVVDRGPIALRMYAHAAFARALASHRDPRASREYARVRDMSRELPHWGFIGADGLRSLAKGLDAYGEAVVFVADEKRDATTWAPLAANASASAIEAWIATRSASIRAVEAEYVKVTTIQPEPPPRRVIAAASRSAAMWMRAADELVARTPAKKRTERIALRDTDAKRAAKACLDYSAKYQYIDDGARACATWLEKNFRHEFPPLDELAITHAPLAVNPVRQGPLRYPESLH